jgi:hypothetical protein
MKKAKEGSLVEHFNIEFRNHRPSWKSYGSGCAGIHFMKHNTAGWLSIDAAEYSEKSSKRVILTLSKDQVDELRRWL